MSTTTMNTDVKISSASRVRIQFRIATFQIELRPEPTLLEAVALLAAALAAEAAEA
jgi:hypothetical protein